MRCRFESCRFHPALPVIVNGAKSDNLGRTTTVVRRCMRCLPRAWAGLFYKGEAWTITHGICWLCGRGVS